MSALIATGLLTVFAVTVTLGVHDANILELDGNLADAPADCELPVGIGPEDAFCPPTDWAAFQDSNGNLIPAHLPAGTIAATGVIEDFVIDDTGPDPTYHEPSNHDNEGIDPGEPGTWGCVEAANPTDKDDIVNAYAIAVQPGGVGTDVYFYFGVERFDNSGTAFIGVWLFQDNVTCDSDGDGDFHGEKQTGDILILTDFTNGGAITSLEAYRFTAGATPADEGTFELITPLGADCTVAVANDFLCAEVNTADVATPWPFQDKEKPGEPNPDPDNIMEISEFFEGGINLTDAFAAAGIPLPDCFGSFMAETRSSDVLLGATLKDYALEDFDTCGDITAHKYHDLNANGVDNSEPDLSGWTIFLDENNDETLQTEDDNCNGVLDVGEDDNTNTNLDGEQCRITDGSGDVSFGELPFGSYDVCEVLQGGWFNSDPAGTTLCETVTVSAATDPFVDFGNYTTASKSGQKFHDLDADGVKDAAEPGLGGWVIYVDYDNDSTRDVGEPFATTSAVAATLGQYTITGINPGTWNVREEAQAGWTCSFPVGCVHNETFVSGGTQAGNDFGNWTTASKSGFKFNDNDKDGNYEPAAPQLDTQLTGWVIELWKLNGTWQFVSADTTDGSGYSFSGLAPGTYAVCEITQADWEQSFPYVGAVLPAGESVFDCTTLTPNSGGTFAPFGIQFVATSGDNFDSNLFGNFLVPPGCALTQGYWKTHSTYGPAAHPDDTWLLITAAMTGGSFGTGPDSEFFDSGLTWIQVFQTNPKGGNAWYILAHQYMAAVLNQLNGAGDVPGLAAALADAYAILDAYDGPKNIAKNNPDRAEAIELAGFLASYNEGQLGVPHCGEDGFTGFTTVTSVPSGGVVWPIALAPLAAWILRRRRA